MKLLQSYYLSSIICKNLYLSRIKWISNFKFLTNILDFWLEVFYLFKFCANLNNYQFHLTNQK